MEKGVYYVILVLILIINMPFMILIGGFRLMVYDVNFYHNEFTQANTYSTFPNSLFITQNLIDYFQDDSYSEPQINVFNQREKSHLLDVKILINNLFNYLYLMIFIFLISFLLFYYLGKKKLIFKILNYGSILTLVSIVVLFLLSLNFDSLFINFHKVFFESGTWIFNSSDTLILMYKPPFFLNSFMAIILNSVIISTLILISTYFLKRFFSNKGRNEVTILKQ